MSGLSPIGEANAIKSRRLISQRLAAMPLKQLGAVLEVDDSTVSRLRSDQARLTVTQFATLLAALGMKAVPTTAKCVRSPVFDAMVTLVTEAMADQQTVTRLFEDVD